MEYQNIMPIMRPDLMLYLTLCCVHEQDTNQ